MKDEKTEGYVELNNPPNGLEFKDLTDEQYRVYIFSDIEIRIDMPSKLNVSASGGHRVFDSNGVSHYIPTGWRHLYWLVKPGKYHFAF